MKKPNISNFKRSLIIYITLATLVLLILVSVSTYLVQQEYKENRHKDYIANIDKSIKHTINHFTKDYFYRVARIAQTTKLAQMLENRDREAIYKMLHKKFTLMQEESSNFKILHVHLSDGTSFLRVHKPKLYGDNLSDIRPMIKEIHKNHEPLIGYETGKYGTVYRVIVPILNDKKQYIGALEVGVDVNFLLEFEKEISNFFGMIFIKDEKLKLFSKPNEIVIDGYRLQSDLTDDLRQVYNKYKSSNKLESNTEIKINDKLYITHVVNIKDFKGQDSVKIIFFHEMGDNNFFLNTLQYIIYIFIFFVLIVFVGFITKRIKIYQNNINAIYNHQLKKIDDEKNYNQLIFDSIPSIMIVSDGESIVNANSTMLEFFGYESLEDFKSEHECICDFFIKEEGYLSSDMGGINWLEYVVFFKDKVHKAKINHDGHIHEFLVELENLPTRKTRSIVTFTDITNLAELNERLEFAVNATNDGLWDWNLTTNEVYFSPRWKSMLGYENHELKDELQTWVDLAHPDDLKMVEPQIQKSHEDPMYEYVNTHRLKHKDGSWVWILDRGQTVFDSNGKAIRMVGFHTDITKQKELENRLLSSQHLFEMFMEHIPALVFIKDEEHKIIYANKHTQEFFNGKYILGLKAEDLLSHEETIKADMFDKNIFKHGKLDIVWDFTNYNNETNTYRCLGFKITDNGIEKNAILMIDISKEYEAQAEVIKLKSALDRSPISIIRTDLEGNIKYVNPNCSKISGYSSQELIGKNPRIFKSDYTNDKIYKEMWETISTGNVWNGDFKNIAKDGSEYWENATISPSFNDTGDVDGYIAFKLDITQTKQMEDELEDKEELMIAQSRHAAMGEMISMIAHQWRQPISVISMGANNILADIELDILDEETLKSGAEDIVYQTQELSKTIDDFRNFFRPGKVSEEVFIEDVFFEAIGVIGKSLENNNIELITEFKGSKKITTYSRELMQVIINILKNAKEALVDNKQDAKKISVLLQEEATNISISICDNAGGIKDDVVDKIFDPYFSTKNKVNGTGLGLYMSQTIVEKHLHGSLKAYNKDNGACFTISLPYTIEQDYQKDIS
ncbi:PAS domain S-box protein [Sulfurimonas sp.]